MRDEWKSTIMATGAPSVTTSGMTEMLRWSAGSWASGNPSLSTSLCTRKFVIARRAKVDRITTSVLRRRFASCISTNVLCWSSQHVCLSFLKWNPKGHILGSLRAWIRPNPAGRGAVLRE